MAGSEREPTKAQNVVQGGSDAQQGLLHLPDNQFACQADS